jgi:hypothetical protein
MWRLLPVIVVLGMILVVLARCGSYAAMVSHYGQRWLFVVCPGGLWVA